jgi:hypothetical protein
MMQLPLAAGQQGRQAFKLLSGSSRLHEVLSIEGLWQEKRTHPIKRSAVDTSSSWNANATASSFARSTGIQIGI